MSGGGTSRRGRAPQQKNTPWDEERGGAVSVKGRRQNGQPFSQRNDNSQKFPHGAYALIRVLPSTPFREGDLVRPAPSRLLAGQTVVHSQPNQIRGKPTSRMCPLLGNYEVPRVAWQPDLQVRRGISQAPGKQFQPHTNPVACLVQPAPGARTLAVDKLYSFSSGRLLGTFYSWKSKSHPGAYFRESWA